MVNNELYVRKAVIMRAWGDEPLRRTLFFIDNTHTYIGGEGSDRCIGLPHNQVFAFDGPLYSRLREAYETGEIQTLSTLYSSIPVDDLACNRYQDAVGSLHGQEDITDSKRVAGGNGQ